MICRLCLDCADDMLSMLDESHQLCDMIESIAPVQILFDDELPTTVCVECTEKVKAFYSFQRLIEKNHHILKGLLGGDTNKNINTDTSATDYITKNSGLNLVPVAEIPFPSIPEDNENILNDLELYTKLDQQVERAPRIVEITATLSAIPGVSSPDSIFKYVCLICLEKVNSQSVNELLSHAKTHFNDGLLQNEPPFICENCTKSFSTRVEFVRHQRAYLKRKPFKCKKCERQFGNLDLLEEHMLKKIDCNEKKLLSCEYCGRLLNKCDLTEHRSTHSCREKLKCELCLKVLSNIRTYRVHMKYHRNGKQHVCDVCTKSYYTHSQLKKHKLSHEATQSYLCSLCGLSFLSNYVLTQHVARHHGIEKCKCRFCKLEFSKADLKVHVQTKHPNSDISFCEICGKIFTSMKSLKKHIKNHPSIPLNTGEITDETDSSYNAMIITDDFHEEDQPLSTLETLDNNFLPQGDQDARQSSEVILIMIQDNDEVGDEANVLMV